MKVLDIMTTPAITVGLDMPVLEAHQLMASRRIRHLPVTDGGRLMGIVTARDIRLNLPAPATSLWAWEVDYLLARRIVDGLAADQDAPARLPGAREERGRARRPAHGRTGDRCGVRRAQGAVVGRRNRRHPGPAATGFEAGMAAGVILRPVAITLGEVAAIADDGRRS